MWYNVIVQKQNPQEHYTAYQLKLPVEIEKIIEISDPVYSFSEVMDHIDLIPAGHASSSLALFTHISNAKFNESSL